MRRAVPPALVAILASSLAGPLRADTTVSGTISTSTTWALSGSPFVVTGEIYVQGAGTPALTIEAGVTVNFNPGTSLFVGKSAGGKLLAVGTASQPIIFTANSASPTAGYWRGIVFSSQTAAGSKIVHATISYGGYDQGVYGAFGGAHIDGSSPVLQNVAIQNCAVAGITVKNGSPAITGSTLNANPVGLSVSYPATPALQTTTISNSSGFAVSMDPRVTLAAISGLTFLGNGTDAIQIKGGAVNADTTWKSGGVPYVVTGMIAVEQSGGSAVLTIKPGVTLKFNSGTYLAIGRSYPGGLLAVGSSSQWITFTANSSAPTPGFWRGIQFFSQATSTSKLSYATIGYGGYSDGYYDWAGIYVNNSSPTFENISVQNCAAAGIIVSSGSPDISASTLSGNAIGLYASYPATPSVQTTSISGSAGPAISIDARLSFEALSGLTLSGNGTDAIEVRSSAIDVNTTWRNGSVPYVVKAGLVVEGSAKPVLTIEAGATLRFNQGVSVSVGRGGDGGLIAVGTSSARISFSPNSTNPAAGFWQGIRFFGKTTSTSTLAYSTVSYGGFNGGVNGYYGGVHVASSSPVFDHVRFDTNAYAGLSANLAGPTIKNCGFTNNEAGLKNQTSGQPVVAALNWWSSASGPSGSGAGSGQSASAGVILEPWLTAAASAPQFVNTFVLKNGTFNPSIGVNASLVFTGATSASWKATFASGGSVVRTITGSGASVTLTWDGKDGKGMLQPNGSYTYKLETSSGAAAAPVFGSVAIDLGRQLTVSGVAIVPAFFSPNGDTVQDTTTLTARTSFDGASWTMKVTNAGGTIVRTVTGSANPAVSFTWDGTNGSNVLQADGVYTLALTVADGSQSVSASATATLDRTLPSAVISSPADNALLSNVYQNGSADVDLSGTGTDANFKNWLLDYGSGSSPSSWTQVSSGTSAVSNGNIATWSTVGRTNGIYSLRLQVWDLAGNRSVTTKTFTIGNFTVSWCTSLPACAAEFNGAAGGRITYTSAVPFALIETISIRNAAGQTVRTLFSGSRSAGTFTDVWNGRDGQGGLLPDGPYFYIATATAGSSSLVWDLTSQFRAGPNDFSCGVWTPISSFQPFNNIQLPLSYGLNSPGRVFILFSSGGYDCLSPAPPISDCSLPGNFCSPAGEYQQSGNHSGWWASVDTTGVFRSNIYSIAMAKHLDNFSQNAVVLFGTKPTIVNPTVQPPYYNPAAGQQTITFDVSSYQSQPVTVSVVILNQESRSVLRTLAATAQPAGRITLLWDGRADNGMWVAPGAYTLTLAARDGIGNSVSRQALAMVVY